MFGYKTVNNILVDTRILTQKFVCDLSVCKGACCTLKSEYGAPTDKEEISVIEKILPIVKKYLPEYAIKEIEENDFWEFKSEIYLIRSINNRDCVFVYYEGDVAKCAIEKAYKKGEIDFPKPISCHLFPIRITNFGGEVIKYEKYNECKSAITNGKKLNTTVVDFLKEPLIRKFGEDFFNELKEINIKD